MLYSSIDLTRRLWVLSFIEASLTEEIAAGEEAKNPVRRVLDQHQTRTEVDSIDRCVAEELDEEDKRR